MTVGMRITHTITSIESGGGEIEMWKCKSWNFVSIVQWAALLHKLAEEHVPEAWEILGNPERTQEYLNRYGITRDAVVAEMERVVDRARKTV